MSKNKSSQNIQKSIDKDTITTTSLKDPNVQEALTITLSFIGDNSKLNKINQTMLNAYIKDQLIGKVISINTMITINIYGKPNNLQVICINTDTQKDGLISENGKDNESIKNKNEINYVITKKTKTTLIMTKQELTDNNKPLNSQIKDLSMTLMNNELDIAGMDEELHLLTEILNLLKYESNNMPEYQTFFTIKGILVYGPSGVGKTSLIKALAKRLKKIKFLMINTRDLLSKYVGESEKKINEIFKEARTYKPCVLFFDDIHLICNKKEVGSQNSAVILNSFINEIDAITSNDQLMVIIATNQITSIDNSLRRAGRFDKEIKIEIPNPSKRLQILKMLLSKVPNNITEDQIKEINYAMNGFTGADILTLIRESVLKSIEFNTDEQNEAKPLFKIITKEAIDSSLVDVNPSGLKDLIMEIPKVYWSDIGGYNHIKHEIIKVIEWPLKHPESYIKMGIKPSRGILLYGPPGCSKTMIAKAIATESKLNFIAIKGPELFSKYVGDSEKAIRDLFKRARLCAPCVIFFDEIDAIATQRSHNTDVSDRVLTQLLTEMDGIETLKHVIVVAATNRPDSLDIALLRPGRFDHHIYISIPDFKCRLEILKINIFGNKMPVSNDVDLENLAQITEGYSGAEICMICREAGLNALSRKLDKIALNSDQEIMIESDCVKKEDFLAPLKKLYPRISKETIEYYENFAKNQKLL